MAVSEEHPESTLYFVRVWHELNSAQQTLVRNTWSLDATIRAEAWRLLLAESDVVPLAIAVDQIVARYASARMGREIALDRGALREAAHRLLSVDPKSGKDRHSRILPNATYIVALRALSITGTSEDIELLLQNTPSTDWDSDLARTWISAALASLRNANTESSVALIAELTSVALSNQNGMAARIEAVVAISSSVSLASERALHEIFARSETDLRIESGAALAARGALTPGEFEFLSAVVDTEPKSPVLLARIHEIQVGLSEYKRNQ